MPQQGTYLSLPLTHASYSVYLQHEKLQESDSEIHLETSVLTAEHRVILKAVVFKWRGRRWNMLHGHRWPGADNPSTCH